MRLISLLKQLIRLIRYRFFLFSGIIPYVLGQAIAFNAKGALNWQRFYLGFLGIILALVGVELFNEYFDSLEGGERIFSQDLPKIPRYFYILGILVFLLAFIIAWHLASQSGWLIMAFSLLGFFAAYFYVGPPLKWAYRGLGEIVIALSYGPFMLLGSYYLQMQRISTLAIFVSFVCAQAMFCLALVNEIPDYYQDKLAGKRNLVVKLGKPKAMGLLLIGLSCMFFLLGLGIILKQFPMSTIIIFLSLPWVIKSLNASRKDLDNPKAYLSAINTIIAIYLTVSCLLAFGYILRNSSALGSAPTIP